MADFKEYKNQTEELEEIIDAIKDNSVQTNDLLPSYDANSVKLTKIFNMMLVNLQKATAMKNFYRDELAKEKIIMEDLEKRMESEREKLSKIELVNRWMKSQLAHHESRKAAIVIRREEYLNELGVSFRKAPVFCPRVATKVGAITKGVAKNKSKVKRLNQRISDRQALSLETLDEDVFIQSVMEVWDIIGALDLMTSSLEERSRVLEKCLREADGQYQGNDSSY